MKDAMGDATLGFKVLVGPDEVALHKKDQKQELSQKENKKEGVPVIVNPVVMKDTMGTADFGN